MPSAALGETAVVVAAAFLRALPRGRGGGGGMPLRDLLDTVDFAFDVDDELGLADAPPRVPDVTPCAAAAGVVALTSELAEEPFCV